MKPRQLFLGRSCAILSTLLILLLFTSCSDVLLEPEQKPDHVLIKVDELGLFIDDEVELNLEIVDKRGNPVENIPAWIDTTVISNKDIVEFKNGKLVAVKPGKAEVIVKVGDFSDEISVRVTPRLYMIQSTQNLNRNVKIVAGRDAVIRLFLNKEEESVARNDISVEIYQNGSLAQTLQFSAQDLNLRPINDTFSTTALFIPGQYIRPGLAVQVQSAAGKSYPASPHPITVVEVPEFHLRLIPIYVPAIGKTGDINQQNQDEYMEALLDMFPLNDYKVDLHAPITINGDPTADQGDFYSVALDQIRAVWLAEGGPDYYYYGVIPQDHGGTVGLGYVDNPKPHTHRQAVGWDYPGYQYRSETLAHELGHNMGRQHAPCGDVASPDPNYPYFKSIGVFGYEVDRGDLKSPAVYKDLMSYCEPAWISDYTYKGIMKFRKKANSFGISDKQPQDVLLLWGRMTKGKLVLEPAFRIKAPAFMPQGSGAYTLSGYDENGNQLFSFSFSGVRVADLKNTRHFAFTVPVKRVNINALQTIQLSGRRLEAMQQANIPSRLAQANKRVLLNNVSARRVNTHMVSIQWKSSQYKMTLVKDAETGEVLGFTGSDISEIKTNAKRLKLYFSDGVHTVATKVSVQ